MKVILKKYSVVLILIAMLGVIVLIKIGNAEEVPKIVLFLGRFHPMLLHLPIGALLVTFFLDIIGRIRKNYPSQIISYALGFSVFFAILTCILGYFLSLEGGYGAAVLNIHFWTALVTAGLTILLFSLTLIKSKVAKKIMLPLFVIVLGGITVTGHYGSVLTHGENFLTEYAEDTENLKTIEVVDSLKMYENVILRIMDEKCIQCHNATKTKGGLSLLSKETLLKGGESGEAIIAGNANSSLLYKQLLLPISDKKHMPPDGKPQLTTEEIWLIKNWLDMGADFNGYVSNVAQNDTLKKALNKYLILEKVIIPKASGKAIAEAQKAGFMVNEMGAQASELNVKFTKKEISRKDLKTLFNMEKQIVELELNNTNLSDDMTKSLNKFENLKMLRLDNTNITDKTLQHIDKLKQLEVLNLFKTSVTDQGIEMLLKSINPKQIYTWETRVGQETAARLQKLHDVQIHNGIDSSFIEETKLRIPLVSPENTYFTDSIKIKFNSNLKNAELRYTLDGKEPDSTSLLYTSEIKLTENANFKVKAFKKGWLPSDVLERDFFKVEYQITDFTIKDKPDPRYPNASKLFDLQEGSLAFRDGKWTGFSGYDVDTTIDLGEPKVVNNISVNCLKNVGNWIMFPTKMIVYTSPNGKTDFKKVGELILDEDPKNNTDSVIKRFTVNVNNTKAQFFKIIVKNPEVLPSWHEAAGNASWIFVDEIFLW